MRAILRRSIPIPRALCAGLTILALVLAPIIVQLTHGPAAAMAAAESLWHGHVHMDPGDASMGAHDAADHEHHVTGLPERTRGLTQMGGAARRPVCAEVLSGVIREGPRRPPRLV